MTVKELVAELLCLPQDSDIYVNSPNRKKDYYVDGVSCDHKHDVFIETAE